MREFPLLSNVRQVHYWDWPLVKPLYALRKMLSSCGVLRSVCLFEISVDASAHTNFACDFRLETDGLGLGTVLSQEQEDGTVRPIALPFSASISNRHTPEKPCFCGPSVSYKNMLSIR